MTGEEGFLMPDYYPEFHCKIGACRTPCCDGWPISISMTDYFRLVGMECPPELRRRLDTALHVTRYPTQEEYAFLEPRWDGHCPIQMEDGRCMIHAELGEDALAPVCRLYPRGLHGDRASCANSCEGVAEILLRRKEQLTFLRGAEREPAPEPIAALQDRTRPLEERLFGFQMKEPAPAVLGIIRQMCEASDSVREYAKTALPNLPGDAERFAAQFPDWEAGFENLLANHMFFANYPDLDGSESREEARMTLCLAYLLTRDLARGYTRDHGAFEDLADVVAAAFRLIEHSAFHRNAAILLRRAGIVSPEKMCV